MEASILISTKKILGLDSSYTAFDLDVITHIKATFSSLKQLGIDLPDNFVLDSDAEKWSDLELPNEQLDMIKTYVYLKVRMLFDPPATSFHLGASKEQIQELEWRINIFREEALP